MALKASFSKFKEETCVLEPRIVRTAGKGFCAWLPLFSFQFKHDFCREDSPSPVHLPASSTTITQGVVHVSLPLSETITPLWTLAVLGVLFGVCILDNILTFPLSDSPSPSSFPYCVPSLFLISLPEPGLQSGFSCVHVSTGILLVMLSAKG